MEVGLEKKKWFHVVPESLLWAFASATSDSRVDSLTLVAMDVGTSVSDLEDKSFITSRSD